MTQEYDCIIIGAGPAGLGAGLYAARDKFKTVLLEKLMPGGQIINTDRIENFPAFDSITGPDLIEKMTSQIQNFGAEIKNGCEVTHLEKLKDGKIAVHCDDNVLAARVVILAPGSDYRKLGVPGEDEFRSAGAGVSYCGTCDAPFFKGKQVLAVGGGNSALEETLHLSKFAEKVTLIHRRDEFRATRVLADELMQKVNEPKSVRLKNVKNDEEEDFPCDGVFIFIGMVPNTGFLNGFVELSEKGFIKCDFAYLRTKVPGVFVAGDCRVGAAMQLATAVGDGVIAALMMKQYFRDPNWWNEPASDELSPGGW
jgi:thioredoxin reductase (NADPH)